MKIQSLSVVVPNVRCMNSCEFCCVKMHDSIYKNQLNGNLPFYDLYRKDYLKRLEYARDNGCNTVMLTGDSEPQQNRAFLEQFGVLNNELEHPFRNIEIQTTGALIDDGYLRFMRNHVGITTISLSISCLNDDAENIAVIHCADKNLNLENLCKEIKKYDFNLRLSLNMTECLMKSKNPSLDSIFGRCGQLEADQVTFRKMYVSGNGPEAKWISDHSLSNSDSWFSDLKEKVESEGRYLDTLEYGEKRYSYKEISVVIDDDCMSSEGKQEIKYLILRPNCKLYTKWDDKASLVF